MILTIARRELRSLFLSPLAWSILAVVQIILAYIFLVQVELFLEWQPRLVGMEGAPGLTDITVTPMLRTAAIVLLLVVPLISMRLLADERRAGTLPLLLSAPVSMSQIVLGKYLGLLGFLACVMAMLALQPLSLLVGGSLDNGLVASGFLGLALLLSSFAAAGLFFSSLTNQPAVAAISTFGLLLFLWIVDWAGATGAQDASELFAYLSMLNHFEAMLVGVFDTRDVAYYLLFTVGFLILTVRRLDSDRLQS